MKYLIIGSGGTGACIGAYLAKQGQDVDFIARGKHGMMMKEEGLRIESARVGDFTVRPVRVFTMEEYTETPDVIFVCVKYYSLQETIAFINRIATKDTLVIPILNVFSTGEELQKACPKCMVLDGCTYIVSMIESPGKVIQPTPIFKVYFGYRESEEKRLYERATQVEADLKVAGIEAYLTQSIKKEALQKFSYVSPVGAAGLYYDGVAEDFMKPGEKQDTFIALVQDVERLAQAMGVTFEKPLAEVNMGILMSVLPDANTSMQRDVMDGKVSEIEGLVHRIVELAKAYEVEVPAYKRVSDWARLHQIK